MFADANAYEQFMGRWSRLIAPLLMEFANLKDGWRILDACSGTGSLAMEISSRLPRCHVTGIELSKQYAESAKSRVSNGKVHFQIGDVQKLPFSEKEFDASLSLLAFNFIPDARKALAELRRVTRPGGAIAVAVWDYGDGMEMLRLFWDAAVKLNPAAS